MARSLLPLRYWLPWWQKCFNQKINIKGLRCWGVGEGDLSSPAKIGSYHHHGICLVISIVGRSYFNLNICCFTSLSAYLETCLPGLRLLFTNCSYWLTEKRKKSSQEAYNQFFKTTGDTYCTVGSFKFGLEWDMGGNLDIFVVDSSSGFIFTT